MADLKTQKNDASVTEFINQVESEQKRKDSFELVDMMQDITGDAPKMWGASIIGFGHYHYKYESGRENDWFQVGFSPRKNALALYAMTGFPKYQHLLDQLGQYKTGKSCLYIKKLDDIDRDVLRKLIGQSVADLMKKG